MIATARSRFPNSRPRDSCRGDPPVVSLAKGDFGFNATSTSLMSKTCALVSFPLLDNL